MRCLVIEDEVDTARYICNGLKEAGHTATLVRDGANGLDLAANERWDVISRSYATGRRRWIIDHRHDPRRR